MKAVAMVAGLATLVLAMQFEGVAAACDEDALATCAKKFPQPTGPVSPSQTAKQCKWAADYFGCQSSAGCLATNSAAKACDASFALGACPGSSICRVTPKPSGPKPAPTPVSPAPSGEEDEFDYEKFPPHAPFFGFMGATAALVFANLGAAYGTAKSGRGISTMGVLYPALVMKHIIPVVMAGVLGIYGLIIAVIIGNGVVGFKNNQPVYTAFKGFAHLGGGLACGLSGLAAGLAIGIVGDYGVRSAAEQPKLYVGMVLVLIFSEALGLYGLIIGLILTSKE